VFPLNNTYLSEKHGRFSTLLGYKIDTKTEIQSVFLRTLQHSPKSSTMLTAVLCFCLALASSAQLYSSTGLGNYGYPGTYGNMMGLGSNYMGNYSPYGRFFSIFYAPIYRLIQSLWNERIFWRNERPLRTQHARKRNGTRILWNGERVWFSL
jgi:hypothetical protein